VPVVIVVLCFGAGVFASARWLPDLAPDAASGLAFFAVCGLLGIALALIGVHLYLLVRDWAGHSLFTASGEDRSILVASELAAMLRDVGTVFGLAGAVFLLARLVADAWRAKPPASS
jgi:hypothetical protein